SETGKYIREHGNVDLPIDEIINHLLDGVIARVRQAVPWRPGARELLRDLRRHEVPCALVTMSWRRFADTVVAALPPGSFDVVITGDEVTNGKPHPEPYITAADRLGVAAKNCVALEDSPTGVRSAVAAGCAVFAIPNVVDIAPGPGYTVVASLTDLTAAQLGATAGRARRNRRWLAVAAVAALATVAVTAAVVLTRPSVPPPAPTIAIDGWAPYWALDVAVESIAAHGSLLRDISPFWYTAQSVTEIVAQPTLPADEAAAFTSAARQDGSRIVPSIFDSLPAGGMAAVLADPVQRAEHVQAIVKFVTDGGFDGIDLDYEQFAFADQRSTWATTSVNWISFLTELSAPLHAAGKTLTVSVPYIYDNDKTDLSGYWVYDYRSMAKVVDRIRIMAYDYSTTSPGPIAPLAFIKRAIAGAKAAVGDPGKLVLGIGLHGYNWPISTSGECPAGTATGRTAVSQASIAALLAKRQATPVHDPVTGEASFTYQVTFQDSVTACTQTREVHYVDAEGAHARMDLARRARFGGVALWAVGYDSDATWAAITPLAAAQ
ncbi:MAG: HAD-IA family hydrolase, partial [Ilumatobacteraceae bacterium]